MALYSDKVMDHFRNPRNVGIIDDADGVGEVGNPVCGDIMKIYLKIADNTITDVKFETFGCGSAIASSSMATELIKGKSLTDALALTNKAVTEALDGLPAHKLHCSVLAEEAIKRRSRIITIKMAFLMTTACSRIVNTVTTVADEGTDYHERRR